MRRKHNGVQAGISQAMPPPLPAGRARDAAGQRARGPVGGSPSKAGGAAPPGSQYSMGWRSFGTWAADCWGWSAACWGWLGEGQVHRQAGHALAQGNIECSLMVLSGRQRGLSPRWRSGVAAVSPGRLDFTREGWPLRATRPLTISHLVVLGPARPPSAEELTWLPADSRITEPQAPAATLRGAVPARYRPGAFEQLQGRPTGASPAAEPEAPGDATKMSS